MSCGLIECFPAALSVKYALLLSFPSEFAVACFVFFFFNTCEIPLPTFYVTTRTTGEQGEDFFLIEAGTVSCTQAKSATDATEMPLLSLGPGDYFGEMALMLDEPRAANCIATEGKVRQSKACNHCSGRV